MLPAALPPDRGPPPPLDLIALIRPWVIGRRISDGGAIYPAISSGLSPWVVGKERCALPHTAQRPLPLPALHMRQGPARLNVTGQFTLNHSGNRPRPELTHPRAMGSALG